MAAGVLCSSVCFAALHFYLGFLVGGKNHELHWVLALNIFLWAVFAALLAPRTGSLWAATSFHDVAPVLPSSLLLVLPSNLVDGKTGLAVFGIEEPNHYTGGTGFAGLFEELLATTVLVLLILPMLLFQRRGVTADRRRAEARTIGIPRSS